MNELNKAIVKAAEALIDQREMDYWDEPDYSALEQAVEAKRAAKSKAKLNQVWARNNPPARPDACQWDGETCPAAVVECNAIHAKARAVAEALAAAEEDCDDEPRLPCYIPDGDGNCNHCHQWAGFGCPEAPPDHPDGVVQTLRRQLTGW